MCGDECENKSCTCAVEEFRKINYSSTTASFMKILQELLKEL